MSTSFRIGPAGIGGKGEVFKNLEDFARKGLRAAEIAFTYGVYLDKEEAIVLGEKAKESDIVLSIHAPYYINLNSDEARKIEASKKRILDCCRIADALAFAWEGKRKICVVFHPGFYSKDKERAFAVIKENILDLMQTIKEKKWNVLLCPEVMGKINVFGSIEEISQLVKETGCGFCIDFAHVLARYKTNEFDLIEKSFPKEKWHCHFSGIVYGDKGEQHHKHTEGTEWKNLFSFLKKLGKEEIVIINESPSPVEDAEEGTKLVKGN